MINDVNVKFTGDQGKGKSKMESIYLRVQEKLEDLDFKNIIKLHRLGITIMMDVLFQLNLELMLIFFRKNLSDYDDRIICELSDYDDRIICELLEFGAPVGF